MGYLMFFGCLLLAYSPAIAIFIQILSTNARLIILSIGSSFFWLLAILLASIWWTVIPPLRHIYFWTIIWTILFQELMRFVFFKLYSKAERGFVQSSKTQTRKLTTHPDNFKAALAFGLGSGVTHSLVTYVSVLWEALGPGTYYTAACPSVSLFLLNAIFSFCFITFHMLWSVVAYDGYRVRDWKKMGAVVLCHVAASYLTLLNGVSCIAGIILVILLLLAFSGYTWYVMMRSSMLTPLR
eukprot:TRINITY_DN6230_c0_g1_i1.p1 TRINITY_DN6230_c0_g1~~TRINITY_DN6230_c0_g1_i1.p1  ORF type:complete len:240 (-),score=25.49 TRINITY_DN6230_c0_g1_i1:50-769(-)